MRRLYHIIGGLFLVLMVSYIDKKRGLILISSLFLVAIIIDAIRLLLPDLNRIFFRWFGPLLRQEEEGRPTGTGYYLAGILISILLFKREIALFSMTILAVGDPAASTIGKRWGQFRIGGKSLEGSIAFFITSLGAGLILYGLWPALPIGILITGAITGTLAELISNKLNDNLIIPLATSGAMEVILFFLNLIYLN